MPHVVVGALVRGGRVLLGHRRVDRDRFPDRWDLPGGHVEPGEQPDRALIRELREELGVEAAVTGAPSSRIEYWPDLDEGLVLDVWRVTTWVGAPANTAPDEHDELRWITASELPRLGLAHDAYRALLPVLLTAGPGDPAQP